MAENDVRSRWTIWSTVTSWDLSTPPWFNHWENDTPSTGWGEPALFYILFIITTNWLDLTEWHMSKTPLILNTITTWPLIHITPNRLRRTNSTSRAEDIVTEDAKVVNANLSWNICDPWLITCASFLVCQGVCFSFPHWVQVRRSQADKPIHSPRDSLISWR